MSKKDLITQEVKNDVKVSDKKITIQQHLDTEEVKVENKKASEKNIFSQKQLNKEEIKNKVKVSEKNIEVKTSEKKVCSPPW